MQNPDVWVAWATQEQPDRCRKCKRFTRGLALSTDYEPVVLCEDDQDLDTFLYYAEPATPPPPRPIQPEVLPEGFPPSGDRESALLRWLHRFRVGGGR